MNPHVWELHASVFELAQARGLRDFLVNYRDAGEEVVIALVLPPAGDAPPSPSDPAPPRREDPS